MNVRELAEKLNLSVLTGDAGIDRQIDGCYIGDLLSWVMSKAKAGNVWLTIMSNINTVAVCTLTDAACIVLCEDVTAEDDVIARAIEQDIPILKSSLAAYELACKLHEIL